MTNYPGTKFLWIGLKKERRKINFLQDDHGLEKTLFFSTLLGSLSKHDGDGSENVI